MRGTPSTVVLYLLFLQSGGGVVVVERNVARLHEVLSIVAHREISPETH